MSTKQAVPPRTMADPSFGFDPALGTDYNKEYNPDEVKLWQKFLLDGGFYGEGATESEIDGKYGKQSAAATERYMESNQPPVELKSKQSEVIPSTQAELPGTKADTETVSNSDTDKIQDDTPDHLKSREAFEDWAGLTGKSEPVSTEQKRKANERMQKASGLAEAFKLLVNAAGGSKGMYIDKIPGNPYFQQATATRQKLDDFDLSEEIRVRNENSNREMRNANLYNAAVNTHENRKVNEKANEQRLQMHKDNQVNRWKESIYKEDRADLRAEDGRAHSEKLARLRLASSKQNESNESKLEYQRQLHEIKAEFEKERADYKASALSDSKSIEVPNSKGDLVILSEQEAVSIFGKMYNTTEGKKLIQDYYGYGKTPRTNAEMKAAVNLLGSPYIDKESKSKPITSPITGSAVPSIFQ